MCSWICDVKSKSLQIGKNDNMKSTSSEKEKLPFWKVCLNTNMECLLINDKWLN